MTRAAWHRLAWRLFIPFAGLALLLTAMFWLANSNAGLRWLTDGAARLSRGQLQIEGVTGELSTSIGIEKLVFISATQRVTLQHLRLQWQPRALLQRTLDVDLLAIESARIERLQKDTTPLQLPASLRLPLAVRIAAWEVARLEFVDAGQTRTFDALHGQLDGLADTYRLNATATSPWAKLAGQVEIDKDAPFNLHGRFGAERREPSPVEARLELSGKLAAVIFKLNAEAKRMHFMANGEVAPFASIRLVKLLLAGEGIDPHQFAVGAPRADLAFSGVFEGKRDPGEAHERLFGTFSLSNQLAGRLDQQRLPLANLTGAMFGDHQHADFSALSVDLGKAGRFDGEGTWRDGRFRVDLRSARLNLAGIQGDLYASQIAASLLLEGDATRQRLTAEVSEIWGKGRFALSHADHVLRLESANFTGQSGRLSASGALRLDPGRAFSAQFDASGINPARFGKFPRARLNALGEVSGALAPTPRLRAEFTLPKGTLEGYPVSGHGRLNYANQQLSDTDIVLDLAGNLARLKGNYGRAGDRLVWSIDAPALHRLHAGLGGSLRADGGVSGDPKQPKIDARLVADDLRLPADIAAKRVNLQLALQATAQGEFTGRLLARGVKLAAWRLDSVDATLRGRRDAHDLTVAMQLPDWRLNATLAGGLDSARVWRGRLNTAEVEGAWPLHLQAPARLQLGRDLQQVDDLVLTLAGGQLNLAQFQRQGAQFSSHGSLSNLPLAPLLGWMEKAPPLSTDLRLNGDWNLRLGDHLDGHARLLRRSGDVRWNDPAMPSGLTQLTLDLRAKANQLSATLAVDTQDAGQLRAEGHATLLRTAAGFSLPRSTPLAWTAKIDVPDLRLMKPFLPAGMRGDARLKAQLAGSGSLSAPSIEGRIEAGGIRFAIPEEGIVITDGTLKLDLQNGRGNQLQGELKGQSGRIVIGGEVLLTPLQADLALTFEKFSISNRSDRHVIVSGLTHLKLEQHKLHLSGELVADRARLQMPESSRPTLSSDVVIVGRPPREKTATRGLPLSLDLKLGLGNDFLFNGGGFDARLGGQLRLFTQHQVLRGEGVIQVVKGRYAAYAQSLAIERGVLRFTGQIDNPGLDVLAVRATPTVKAGVQVGGSVQRPLVTLYSDPPLPDTEKLSWLVLGHGLDGVGQQEFVLLQIAAGAVLRQAESVNLQANLAEALHIDSFNLRAGTGEDVGSSVISVGKQISSRATLSYEQSLDGLNQVVKVLYQLSPRVRLEAQTGNQSSFDAFYSLEFD